jgi:glutathione synthase/RimK-type ligase-like ATP-grasp enzyme
VVLHRENLRALAERLSLPCVLKQPDSCFSQGVIRAFEQGQVVRQAEALLSSSDLIVAQEYVPTAYDWRVGIFDNEPIWACKYYMAPKHWQIIKSMRGGGKRSGRVESVEVGDAPREIVELALRAASLIGDGLYGVDLKSTAHGPVVVEVNDNPSIDAGYEDALLKDRLYDALMTGLRRRVDSRRPAALGCGVETARASQTGVRPQPSPSYRD